MSTVSLYKNSSHCNFRSASRVDLSLVSPSPIACVLYYQSKRTNLDKEGIAIILCETQLEHKYKALVQGKTILESCLHVNLSEHLNSEIGLGTITNISSAKEWLRSSFLFQRIKKNPDHYSLGKDAAETWEQRVDALVMQSVEKLQKTELVEYATGGNNSGELESTEYGDIMSKVE